MSWINDCKAVLAEALLEVTRAARGLKQPLDTELPEIPVPDPGKWEICRGVRWPYRDEDDEHSWNVYYRAGTVYAYADNREEARDLAKKIIEIEDRVPSRILQVIRKLEELRNHLLRLAEEREQTARAILESPEEQEAIAAIRDRLALLRLRGEEP
jgi:hypothetical protein